MEIYELANTLGEAIANSEELEKYRDAQDKVNVDADAVALVEKYGETRNRLVKAMESGAEKELIKAVGEELESVNREVESNPILQEMLKAQEVFQGLINNVDSIINSYVSGNTKGCGPDGCSGCSGCS